MTLHHRLHHPRPGGLRARQGQETTPSGTPTTTAAGTLSPSGGTPPNTSSTPSTSSASSPSASSLTSVPSTTTTSSTLPSTTSLSLITSSAPITSTTTVQPTSDTTTTPPLTTSTSSEISRLSRVVSTNADGGVVTITTLVDAPTSSTNPASNNDNGDSVGFLQNKAAMAATFAVAGIAAVVFAFLFITTCIRRRRAMKFDRDVAAAAAVAAAESQAIRPYDDDDDDVFTGAPRAQGGGYGGYAPGKMADHDPYVYAAAGVVGSGPGGFGAPAQPMRQQQTGGPLAYPTAQQYPVQPFDQPYNGGIFGRQVGHQEVYNLQDLGMPTDMPRRPGSAGTGHDSLPGIAGVGTRGSTSGPSPGPGRSGGIAALVGAAGLASGAGAGAAAAYRNQHDDPYGGYISSPVGESRYPQPRWSQQQGSMEPQQGGWYQQHGQQPMQQQQQRPPSPMAAPAPAYSPPPGALTAQGYPNEKSTYSNARSVASAQTLSVEGPSTSGGHTAVSANTPGTPLDEDDVGSILEETEGPRVLKVTNE